jgi:uncharacterized protein
MRVVNVVVEPEPHIRIGIVSDTHGYFDPQLPELLKGTNAILHAGDVGASQVLDELRLIAPVHAVRGNMDGAELSLPLSLELNFGGLQIEMVHILAVPQSELEAWGAGSVPGGKAPKRSERFLAAFKAETGVVVFGHSHSPCLINLGDRLFFNPGSAGKRRFSLPRCCGILEIRGGKVWASLVSLEKDGPPLPGKVSMDLEVSDHAEIKND